MEQNRKNKGKYVGMYRSTLDNLSTMTPYQFSDLNKPVGNKISTVRKFILKPVLSYQ